MNFYFVFLFKEFKPTWIDMFKFWAFPSKFSLKVWILEKRSWGGPLWPPGSHKWIESWISPESTHLSIELITHRVGLLLGPAMPKVRETPSLSFLVWAFPSRLASPQGLDFPFHTCFPSRFGRFGLPLFKRCGIGLPLSNRYGIGLPLSSWCGTG